MRQRRAERKAARKAAKMAKLEGADCGKSAEMKVTPVILMDLEDIDLDQLEY